MNEVSPCKGCANRTPGCHGSCKKYEDWLDAYHAQKKALSEIGNRWQRPWSPTQERLFRRGTRFHRYGY